MASLAEGSRASTGRLIWVVGLLALSVLLNYVDRGAIGVAAPLMKQELALSATAFGTAVSAFFWTYAPLCVLVGWLCDRFCVYRVFAAGIAVWALATMLTGFVGGLGALIALRLLLGMGESIAFPGSSKIFAAEVPVAHRGLANALVAAALAFGPALGTLAGGTILQAAGWRPIFWSFGAITLLWLVPWQIVSAPLRRGGMARPVVEPVALARLLPLPTLWLMGVAHFLTNYGFYFLLAWLPLYFVKTLGFTIPQMTLVTSLGFAAQGIAALVSGRMSDLRVAAGANEGELRRRTLIVGQLLGGTMIAALWFAHTPFTAGLCLVVAGLGVGLLATNIFAVGQIFAGPRAAGGWIGVQNAIGNTAGIIGPILTGMIVDRLGGYGWAFAIAAGVTLFGIAWWRWAIPEIREIVPLTS